MVEIHPSAVVDSRAQLGEDVKIGPNCVVDGGVTIGAGTCLEANVVMRGNVKIGLDNHFWPQCVIGAPPQVLGLGPDEPLGGIVVGDRNHFREQVTIHPSRCADHYTTVGNDNLLMVGSHIGHDCVVEDKAVLSNYDQIAGHCKIESGAWLSAMVGLHQFVTIGKWCYTAGLSGISHDVPPFVIVSGHYPPRIRGINKRGLRRAGFSEEQQERISEAYKSLYRRGGTLLENAKALAQQDGLDENVKAMIDAITKSSQHRFGRYLETFRC